MLLVCINFLSIEITTDDYEHILVITDHFTRNVQAIKSGTSLRKPLPESYLTISSIYDFPFHLQSDQGHNFKKEVIKELCSITNINR